MNFMTSSRSAVLATATLLTGSLFAACDQGSIDPQEAIGNAQSFSIWAPGANDTCTREIHDSYSVVGPDKKLYPTWHPAVDPKTGCRFGHEHGRDPSGSHIYAAVGPIPFGYANEQLDAWDPGGIRHEDHFGHKVEWENDIDLSFGGSVGHAIFGLRCDVLTKLHQGTHSKDAFTNNLHELVYHIRCRDGTRMDVTIMSAIGTPGEFVRSCDRDVTVVVGPATPANSPRGGGERIIPDRTCIEQFAFAAPGKTGDFDEALHESWQTSNSIETANGRGIAFFNPYFQVRYPSRYYDPSLPDKTGRSIAMCYETLPNGFKALGGPCRISTGNLSVMDLVFDDPRSAFDGASRTVDINYNEIRNEDGPEIWYTDPFGKHGRTEAFPGSIAQFIAKINNDRGVGMSGPQLGDDRPYTGSGVHAPN
jgi:hypothetical protein